MNLFTAIREAVANDRVVVSLHAAMRLRQRRIPTWQVVSATAAAKILRERSDAIPNPAVELEILLPDGATAVAVWAWMGSTSSAKLVTVYFPE